MDSIIALCLEKATELQIQDYDDGFIVACTDWAGSQQLSSLTFDFYLVAEVDASEGRIAAVPCANYSNNQWHSRNGEPLNFWACNLGFLPSVNQLSYFHLADITGIALEPQPVFSFNTSDGIAVANASNKKSRSKIMRKKLDEKPSKLRSEKIQATQADIKRFIGELCLDIS